MMGAQLDLNDVAADNPLALAELSELRAERDRLYRLWRAAEVSDAGYRRLMADATALREALGKIACGPKMSTASNADERLVDCVVLINSMIDTAIEALVATHGGRR
jgi:hypothetical protein